MWRGAYSPAPAARSPLCCCRGSVCLQLFLVIRAQFLFTALKSSCVAKLFKTRCNAPLLPWRVLWWQPVLQEEVLPYRRLFYRRRELPARLCVAGSADLNSLCQLSDDVFYLQAKEQRLSGRTCLWVFDMKATIWVQIRWSTLKHYYTSCLLRLFTLQCCCHVQRCLRCDCWSLMNEPLLFSWPDARLVFRVRCVLHIADSGEQQEERVVRWVLGGELQLQTDELVQERRQQQEVHRWVYFL